MTRARIGVLASGGGTNLEALFAYLERLGERRGGDVVMVASDRRDAGALARARGRNVPAVAHATAARAEGPALGDALRAHDVDLVALAGYLRHVPDEIVRRYRGRIVNVHPALLPAFGGPGMYGRRVHDAVLAAGVTVTGVTTHFVDEVYDRGAIIAQWPVPVLDGDDASTLAARVLRVEHVLYPRVVDGVARGRITLAGSMHGRALTAMSASAFTLNTIEDANLDEALDRALGI